VLRPQGHSLNAEGVLHHGMMLLLISLRT